MCKQEASLLVDSSKSFRREADCVGEQYLEKELFYGIHTYRAKENFPITGLPPHKEMIFAIAEIKKASAICNERAGVLSQERKEAIVYACEEILQGKYHEYFQVDPIQGGAGTSHNMNANEVIANIGLQFMGKELGAYAYLHPLDDVNKGQSTNDVYPSTGKLALLRVLETLLRSMTTLQEAFTNKAKQFDHMIKMGRTQLQDAVPIRLGQEFAAYAYLVERNTRFLHEMKGQLMQISLGGTAIGTGLNADRYYYENVVAVLAEVTQLPLQAVKDRIDATQNLDIFTQLSGRLKSFAMGLSKIANDLRLMCSGPTCGLGELHLPARQAGSSIMPGKVNPVIPEVVNQVCFACVGYDATVSMAVEAGQLELNAFEPIIFHSLLQAMDQLKNAIETLVEHCILGIEANEETMQAQVENSYGIITAFSPHIGYEKAVEVVHKAQENSKSIRHVLKEEKLLSDEQIDHILQVEAMTSPGILSL